MTGAVVCLSFAVVIISAYAMLLAGQVRETRDALQRMAEGSTSLAAALLEQACIVEQLERRLVTIEGKRWLDADGNVRKAGA